MIIIQRVKFFKVSFFATKNLHDDHPGNIFLQKGIDFCYSGSNIPVSTANMFAEKCCNIYQKRENRKGDQRQFPGKGEGQQQIKQYQYRVLE